MVRTNRFPHDYRTNKAATSSNGTTDHLTTSELERRTTVWNRVHCRPFRFASFSVFTFFTRSTITFALLFSQASAAASNQRITTIMSVNHDDARVTLNRDVSRLKSFIFGKTTFTALQCFTVRTTLNFDGNFNRNVVNVVRSFFIREDRLILDVKRRKARLSKLVVW